MSAAVKLEGPRLLAAISFAVALMIALVVAAGDLGAGIRATARSSLVLFALTFAASSLVTLRPAPASKWLLRNRRWLGLGFAVSHLGHGILIVALAATAGLDTGLTTAIGGGAGYVLLAAMAATSTDAAQRRLGRRRWRALHLAGMYLAWVIFTSTYAGLTLAHPAHVPALVLLLTTLGLRMAAWARRRRVRTGRTSGAAGPDPGTSAPA